MQIKKIIIQSFKSFDSPQVFDIEKLGHGFFFITGDNRVEPHLGANGSGKSSMLESACFCLYGKTSTNLKAGSVKNWNSKPQCKVSLEFSKWDSNSSASIDYVLTRTLSPNSLTLTAGNVVNTVTQEELDNFIGLDFNSFIYSIFISQFSSKFFDLSPADKMQVFSNILDPITAEWLQHSDAAKNLARELEISCSEYAAQNSVLEGNLQTLNSTNYAKLSEEWEKERSEKHSILCNEILAYSLSICKHKDRLSILNKKLNRETKFLKDISEEIAISNEKINKLRNELSEINGDLKAHQSRIAEKNKLITQINSLKAECQTCFQSISEKHKYTQIENVQKYIDWFTTEQTRLLQNKADIEAKLNKLLDVLKEQDLEKSEINKEVNSLTVEIKTIEHEIKNHETLIEKNNKQMGELALTLNPYVELQKKNSDKKKILTKIKSDVENTLSEIYKNKSLADFWVKGFKDIRNLVITEAVQELEININNNFQRLGLQDWSVKLQLETETKSGTIKKNFSVFIKSPRNTELVPFECWSGGEGQRLKLASTLGLIEFIQSRTGSNWNIEIWDEPSTFLSENGIEDLLETLFQRAKDTGKSIFLIDHRNLNTFGGFDGIINIVKTESGSSIECQLN